MIVTSILTPLLHKLCGKNIAKLVKEFRTQPISFFSSLRADLLNEELLRISREGRNTMTEYQDIALAALGTRTFDDLVQCARRRAKMVAKRYL